MIEPTETQEPPKVAPVSRIIIEFPNGPGTSTITVKHEGIHSAQAYAAAWYLDKWAQGLYGFEQAQRSQALATAVPADVQAVVQQLMGAKR